MKIASWNVNSMKVRLPHVLDWLASESPDVLTIQETKLPDDKFPVDEIEEAGYQVVCSGQRTYNGVATISKRSSENVITDVPGLDDPQRRILGTTIGNLRVLNLYVVNGQEVGSEKYQYKLEWLDKVTQYIARDLENYENYVVLGDFNITPDDRDLHNPERWKDRILCSEPERTALNKILELGFQDTFRLFDQPEKTFSWWDYRQMAFSRNRGMRIDLILANHNLAKSCERSYVDVNPRRLERPSDHAPVVAVFDFEIR